jgi:hypothetical protein
MALNIYSIPACSDEPERVFSKGSNLLQQRRRRMLSTHVQEVLCLQSWQGSGLVRLDGAMFERVVQTADKAESTTTIDSDDEVVYHEHEQRA